MTEQFGSDEVRRRTWADMEEVFSGQKGAVFARHVIENRSTGEDGSRIYTLAFCPESLTDDGKRTLIVAFMEAIGPPSEERIKNILDGLRN